MSRVETLAAENGRLAARVGKCRLASTVPR